MHVFGVRGVPLFDDVFHVDQRSAPVPPGARVSERVSDLGISLLARELQRVEGWCRGAERERGHVRWAARHLIARPISQVT